MQHMHALHSGHNAALWWNAPRTATYSCEYLTFVSASLRLLTSNTIKALVDFKQEKTIETPCSHFSLTPTSDSMYACS
jgi:hypothetical protein